MTDKQDIITQIESLQQANAQAFALSDIAEIIYKYEEKLNRQYTDAKRKYERLKKSGSSVNAMHDSLNKQSEWLELNDIDCLNEVEIII